ncbi:NCS1 nucleoside transporter family [Fomes fomentarius]|nr:NCS1 nucleoside transporter family [Fomes fomentarius]
MPTITHWLNPSSWALEPYGSDPSPHEVNKRWSNKDMDPVPSEKRTWTSLNYVAYWASDAWSVAQWQTASSMLAVGLSWWQALSATAAAYTILAIVMTLNGTAGARLHINFPVIARSSFGFWFSYFAVGSRIVLAMFWLSILAYIGSQCLYQQMLRAIWPSIATIPNHLPPDAQISASEMMCFFLYWLILLSTAFLSPQKIRWVFTFKAIIVPPAWAAIFVWAVVKVPISSGLIAQRSALSGSALSGSALSYAWLGAMNSALGSYASMAVNIQDFTRYAKNEQAQYVQLFIIPVAFTLVCFIGIVVTSAGSVLYGEMLWNPLQLIDRWDNRPATFFVAFTFAFATLGTIVSATILSAANDLTAICPKYIDLKRAQILVVVIAPWTLIPWKIDSSAKGFLSFINGYTVFLGPFAGIILADYWIVHRCKVDLPAMYTPRGRYRYTSGCNWRAALTLLLTVPPNLPGLIASINPAVRIDGASRIYSIAWIFGFSTSIIVYSLLSIVFPARETFLADAASEDIDVPRQRQCMRERAVNDE